MLIVVAIVVVVVVVVAQVTEFFKKAKANEIARDAHCGEDDFMCQMQAYWTAPFLPNLLNTVVFLVETSQMISVFFANYKGRPWMKGMLENHPLFLSVFACIGGVIVAAWEFVPQLNELIQLAPFPNDAFRYGLSGVDAQYMPALYNTIQFHFYFVHDE